LSIYNKTIIGRTQARLKALTAAVKKTHKLQSSKINTLNTVFNSVNRTKIHVSRLASPCLLPFDYLPLPLMPPIGSRGIAVGQSFRA